MKIADDVLDIIKFSKVDEKENVLFLPPTTLERKLYMAVNACLDSIGGKWNKKLKGHLFDHNPSDDLDEMITSGEWTDKKKEFQFFSTPLEIASRMIKLAEIEIGDFILEPSAGDGALLDLFPKQNRYFAIELMPDNCKKLTEKGYLVCEGDFLEFSPASYADKIIMNPPFSKQQDVKHILHAWECLAVGGRLVSIVSESPFFRDNYISINFRKWLLDNSAVIIELNSGDFKSSGTMVKTRMIVVDKK